MYEIPEKHREEIASWQDAPISVEDITKETCSFCQTEEQYRKNCFGWRDKMGLGKYCYESYLKMKE